MTRADTATAHALRRETARPQRQHRPFTTTFDIAGATSNDLRDFSVGLPQGVLACITGVGYLRLGQALSTLSGGEAQRIKLVSELTKTGNIYVMDEPTTSLHPTNIDRLLAIIDGLIAAGNTVIVIEHNLDAIATADWIIDLGPEGGKNGVFLVAEGTPEAVADRYGVSHTGRYPSQYWCQGSDRAVLPAPA